MYSSVHHHRPSTSLVWLKRWIWVYFWLLMFEGAVRKWVVPGLSAPLALVRDPVLLLIYFQALRTHKFVIAKLWPVAFLAVALLLLAIAQIMAGIVVVPIAVFGLRSYLLHLPLIVVIAETLDEEDLQKLGRWLMLLAAPMTLLMIAQYYAAPGSWLNAGAGTDAEQMISAGGHFRASGTFSFAIGIQFFLTLVAAFVLYAFTHSKGFPRWMVWVGAASVIAGIPFSGSRTVLFLMGTMVLCVMVSSLVSLRQMLSSVRIALAVGLVVVGALQLQAVQDAIETFQDRWQQAEHHEGDAQAVFQERVLGMFTTGIDATGSSSWLGAGIGMGSNFAARLTVGSPVFLLAEMEWPRVMLELGPLFGIVFLCLRVIFAGYLIMVAALALKRENALPWLLLPGLVSLVLMGIMEQPTYLGFGVFEAGLCLAASRMTKRYSSLHDTPWVMPSTETRVSKPKHILAAH